MATISARLAALENRPRNKVPRFSVELADGETLTAHGYELLVLNDVKIVHYDPMNSCADTVIALFKALCPRVEVIAD